MSFVPERGHTTVIIPVSLPANLPRRPAVGDQASCRRIGTKYVPYASLGGRSPHGRHPIQRRHPAVPLFIGVNAHVESKASLPRAALAWRTDPVRQRSLSEIVRNSNLGMGNVIRETANLSPSGIASPSAIRTGRSGHHPSPTGSLPTVASEHPRRAHRLITNESSLRCAILATGATAQCQAQCPVYNRSRHRGTPGAGP